MGSLVLGKIIQPLLKPQTYGGSSHRSSVGAPLTPILGRDADPQLPLMCHRVPTGGSFPSNKHPDPAPIPAGALTLDPIQSMPFPISSCS